MLFTVLGSTECRRENGELVDVAAGRRRMLLTALLLDANSWVRAEKLIDAVWGDRAPRSARGSTKTYVWQLRSVLGGGAERIETGEGGYRIRVERDELDLFLFQDAVRAGRAELAAGRAATAAAELERACALWRGQPYADLDTECALALAAQLTDFLLCAKEDLARAQLAHGAGAQAVVTLRALAAQHPLAETLQGLLMLALYRAGRQAEALAVFERTRRLLDEELGVLPCAALLRVHREILVQSAELARPEFVLAQAS